MKFIILYSIYYIFKTEFEFATPGLQFWPAECRYFPASGVNMYNRILVSGQVFDGRYSFSFFFGPWSPRGPRDDEARHSFPGPPLAVQVPDQTCNCFPVIIERNFVAKVVIIFDLTITGGYN